MNAPSVKTIMTRLGIEKPKAQAVKSLMANATAKKPYEALAEIDEILDNYGVEYAPSKNDDGMFKIGGLDYSNSGDSYRPTIIYDHGRGRWYCCSVGDIVERDSKRFG